MKLDIKPEKCEIDLMSMSAHKIHGLKGAGALYIRKGVRILPHILGGGQENGIVSGTQAMPNIAAFAAAVESLGSIEKRYEHVKALNAYLREKISDSVPVGSIATVLYIDDLDNVFIEWVSNGRLTSFSKKNFKSLFEMA
jgi:cysteine sulfinate desulfinase/cysteine desulfurase-like protein